MVESISCSVGVVAGMLVMPVVVTVSEAGVVVVTRCVVVVSAGVLPVSVLVAKDSDVSVILADD